MADSSAPEVKLIGDKGSELVAPLGMPKKVTVVAVPDEYAERVIGFLRGIEADNARK